MPDGVLSFAKWQRVYATILSWNIVANKISAIRHVNFNIAVRQGTEQHRDRKELSPRSTLQSTIQLRGIVCVVAAQQQQQQLLSPVWRARTRYLSSINYNM